MRSPTRGLSLIVVLACLSALVLLLFTAVSAALSHLNLANRVTQKQHAKNLAEAALAQTISELSLAGYKPLPEGRVEVSIDGIEDGEGIVTFLPEEFPDDFSTYRLLDPDGELPSIGARGRTVPRNSAHLVARGRVGTTEHWIECIYHRPPFPNGLTASGQVQASGLYLTGVLNGSAYGGGPAEGIAPEHRLPANLFSNSSDRPVELSNNSHVNGSVASVGSIQVNSGSTVAGELLPDSEPSEIPALDLEGKIATLIASADPVVSTTGDLTLPDGWYSHSDRNLTVGGDLDLNGSVLCVQGDLTLQGALKGTGFLLVDGDVTITQGGNSVVSADQIAVAGTGDIVLEGAGPENSYFQGLLYSEGDLEARNITVFGALVTNGRKGKEGSVTLDNVRMVYNPSGVTLSLRGPQGFSSDTRLKRVYGVSAAVRAGQDSGEYLADVEIYMSHGKASKRKLRKGKIILDQPKTWPEDKSNPKDSPHAIVVSRTSVPFNLHNVESVARSVAKELVEEIVDRSRPPYAENTGKSSHTLELLGDQGGGPGLEALLEESLRDLVDQEVGSHELTFDLNKLLSRETSSSRILIWRTWER